jgi:hypothetical protein
MVHCYRGYDARQYVRADMHVELSGGRREDSAQNGRDRAVPFSQEQPRFLAPREPR